MNGCQRIVAAAEVLTAGGRDTDRWRSARRPLHREPGRRLPKSYPVRLSLSFGRHFVRCTRRDGTATTLGVLG
jgi:hypothetical protein